MFRVKISVVFMLSIALFVTAATIENKSDRFLESIFGRDKIAKRSVDQVTQKLECLATNESKDIKTQVEYNEIKCNNTGEYRHEIDLIDGTKHKAQGYIDEDGYFIIHGYFTSPHDPKVLHYYVHDKNGFKYTKYPISDSGSISNYEGGDESITNGCVLSLLG